MTVVILLVIGLIFLLLAALNVSSPRFNLFALGMFFWLLAYLYPNLSGLSLHHR